MNKIIPLQEMIEEIKKYYNLNDTLLALNLKVTPQTVKGWKDGNIPREKTYNKILEIYNNIINSEEQTEEVQEITEEKKPYEISYPKEGAKVWSFDCYLGTLSNGFFNIEDRADRDSYNTGLLFDSYKEVNQFLKEQTLIKKIKCWAKEQQGDWEWESGFLKYSCCIILRNNPRNEKGVSLDFAGNDYFNPCSKLPYFKSREIAQACIDEFGDEILEVFC